ncbi:MAG: 3D domain-containing protein [Anaerovoracaceae bacterium]
MKKYKVREGSPLWWGKFIGAFVLAMGTLYIVVELLTLCPTLDPVYAEAETIKMDKPKVGLTYIGEYKATYYCPCEQCCGKSDGITASGEKAVEGQTIACPPDIPFGTVIVLEDKQGNKQEYICQDRGGAIKDKRLDIYMDSHNECLKNGVNYFKVYVKN